MSTAVKAIGPAALILVAYDIFHALVIRPGSTSAADDLFALGFALALVMGGAAVLALLSAAAIIAFDWLTRLLPTRFRHGLASLVVMLAASPVLLIFARQPFVGNRYRDSPVALYGPWVLLVVLGIITATGIWVVSWLLRRLFSEQVSRRFCLAISALIIVAVLAPLVAVDTLWFAGWYPVVHSALSAAAAVVLLMLLALAVWHSRRFRTTAALATVVLAMVALGTGISTRWLERDGAIWRVVTGTAYSSRLLTPVMSYRATAVPSLAGLGRLPGIDTQELIRDPAVTGTPPALASNGLLITVDALRHDALGIAGSSHSLTPQIDRYFADGQIFGRAYAQYAATRHSIRALLESRFHEIRDVGSDDLINRLRDYDTRVIALLPTDMKTFVDVERYNFSKVAFYEDPATILPELRRLTEGESPDKRVVWVHLYQPHDPYEPPGDLSTGSATRDMYDGEVRWVDRTFAEIVSLLATPRTVVALGADHGEEFREHGGTTHGRTVYDETIRVPLALKAPGMTPARRSELVANVDIAPTLLAAMGIPIPDTYDGYDLMGRASAAPPDRVVYSQSVTNAVAAMRGGHKWIHWTDLDLWEAYDVDADPAEQQNLLANEEVMRQGRPLVSKFELTESIVPRLRRTDARTYAAWLRTQSDPSHRASTLGRWAGYLAGPVHERSDEVGHLLVEALDREQDPVLRLTILEALGSRDPGPKAAPLEQDDDPGILFETLRHRDVLARRDLVRSSMSHRLAAVRTRAAGQFAAAWPEDAATLLTDPAIDTAVKRGLLDGLASQSRRLTQGFFAAFVDDADPQVRVAALAGACEQSATRAVDVLKSRRQVENSPLVTKLILEKLLTLDREEGVSAMRAEIAKPILSDSVRARLIVDANVVEVSRHLLTLFEASESGGFRRYLFRSVTTLKMPAEQTRALVRAMQSRAFEPVLRARIQRFLDGAQSDATQDQNREAGEAG